MIERALQGDAGVIPFALWEQVWSVLSAITDDPDPAFDGSDEIDSARDPFNLSLNTTRGKAMHAVVRYAVWVARHSPRERPEELRLPRGLDEISGVRPLLERHLDPGIDASPAIRSVYGCYFPVLAAIDPAWALANRERVFPVEGREDRLWQGAWDGYLVNNRVYGFADQLLTEYRRAVERCREFRDEGNSSGQPSKRLAEHIMILFGRGTVTLDGAGLVESFFDRAPPGLQQHALQFVGKSFSGEKPPPAAVFDRFKGLWVWLVERAERSGGGSPQRRALASFGSWFASGHFDPAWSIAELEKALKLAGQIGDAHAVIRSLGNYVGDFAAPTLRCLRAIIESDSQGWEISATVEVVRAILNATVVSSDVGVANEANEIVHLLGRRGFGSFRTLLSKRSG